ncbi:uncharacterized protein METZ01_LOCUS450262, partial [marine metagenome]
MIKSQWAEIPAHCGGLHSGQPVLVLGKSPAGRR